MRVGGAINLDIKTNIESLKSEIPSGIELIAVSKTKPLEDMEIAYQCGIRDFGENKVQEILSKYDNFHKDVRWHLIGHLQTNKVKYLVGKVSLIQSLDSIKLLKEIERVYSKHNMIIETLIQVNIGREEQKYGILEENLEEIVDEIEKCSFVKVKGIMVIIPIGSDYENRQYFNKTHGIWEKLKNKQYKNIEMKVLSMGMSNDYKLAIEEGSTMIRVGQGIFGEREYKN